MCNGIETAAAAGGVPETAATKKKDVVPKKLQKPQESEYMLASAPYSYKRQLKELGVRVDPGTFAAWRVAHVAQFPDDYADARLRSPHARKTKKLRVR